LSNTTEQATLEAAGNLVVRQLANPIVYPCILLTHIDVGRLAAAGCTLAQRFGWRQLSVGAQLSAALLDTAPKRRPQKASHILTDAISELAPGPILCGDVDLLFEPSLQLDPLRLLREASRLTPLVVLWPGQYQAHVLCYAVPEHTHYRTWRSTELCDGCIIGL